VTASYCAFVSLQHWHRLIFISQFELHTKVIRCYLDRNFDKINISIRGKTKFEKHDMMGNKSWNENFEMLKRYREEHGKLPPTNEKLGSWMKYQRAILKQLKVTGDTNNRLEKFEEHGVLDDLISKNEKLWNEKFEKLIRYREEHGKLPPGNEKGLGMWMRNQKAILKKLKVTDGTNDRLEKFEEHGVMDK